MMLKRKKLVLGVFLLATIFTFCYLEYLWMSPNSTPWKYTDALSREVIDDLCTKFSLSIQDARCNNSTPVYASDFDSELPVLIEEGNLATYEDWSSYFGSYQTYCNKPAPDFLCHYDFQGDDVFVIFVFFDGDENMADWRFSVLED